jgi:hypothetical protein
LNQRVDAGKHARQSRDGRPNAVRSPFRHPGTPRRCPRFADRGRGPGRGFEAGLIRRALFRRALFRSALFRSALFRSALFRSALFRRALFSG